MIHFGQIWNWVPKSKFSFECSLPKQHKSHQDLRASSRPFFCITLQSIRASNKPLYRFSWKIPKHALYSLSLSLSIYIYIYIYVCVCVCVIFFFFRAASRFMKSLSGSDPPQTLLYSYTSLYNYSQHFQAS